MKHLLCICAAALALSAAACAQPSSSCSVKSNADGSATINCTDGSSSTIEPGATGATGATGAQGTRGATGATGAAGGNCTIADNDNGTATITCPAGSATVSDGHGPCTTLVGNFNVTRSLDIAAFQAAGCTEISGNLNITATGKFALGTQTLQQVVSDLSGLSNLTKVTGNVDIEGDGATNADDMEDLLQATSFQGLQNLASVGGSIYIGDTTWVTSINLASLALSPGTITIGDESGDGNVGLQTLELAKLANPVELDIEGNSSLGTVTLTGLTSAGTLTVNDTVATALTFPALTTITNTLAIDNNADLTTLSFPAGPVAVTDGVTVSNDPELCAAPADFTGVTPAISGDGTCG